MNLRGNIIPDSLVPPLDPNISGVERFITRALETVMIASGRAAKAGTVQTAPISQTEIELARGLVNHPTLAPDKRRLEPDTPSLY